MDINTVRKNFVSVCAKCDVDVVVPIKENGRLSPNGSGTLARVKFNRSTRKPTEVEFSKHYLATCSDDDIMGTIIHEATHYIQLVKTGNTSHGPEFKALAMKLGCSKEHAKAVTHLENPTKPKHKYEILCPTCKKVVGHADRKCAKLDKCRSGRCVCGACRGRLEIHQNW